MRNNVFGKKIIFIVWVGEISHLCDFSGTFFCFSNLLCDYASGFFRTTEVNSGKFSKISFKAVTFVLSNAVDFWIFPLEAHFFAFQINFLPTHASSNACYIAWKRLRIFLSSRTNVSFNSKVRPMEFNFIGTCLSLAISDIASNFS